MQLPLSAMLMMTSCSLEESFLMRLMPSIREVGFAYSRVNLRKY